MGIILSVNIEYKEEETMDIIKKFGEMVGSTSLKDAKKARKLLLLGYQLQEKRLLLFPDKKLPYSGQYVARIVMQISSKHFRNRRILRWSASLCRENF